MPSPRSTTSPLPTRNYLWVFEADITACFDEIDHSALMDRVRRRIGDKRILALVKAFLRAGVLSEDGVSRATIAGTPQGGILSPLLANIALSILDEHFTEKYEALGAEWTRAKHRRAGGPVMRLVRYADDFVVLVAGTRDHAEALRGEVSDVLVPMGLRLSEEKTRVCHVDEGFDFLGWRIQRRAWRGRSGRRAVYTYPSKKSLLSVMDRVRTLTRRRLHRTLADLLQRLNPVLRGWCNYFRHGVCKQTFGYIDHYTWWKIVTWIRKRHLGLNWGTIKRRFLPGWEISAEGVDMFRPRSVAHRALPIPGQANPHAMGKSGNRIASTSGMISWRAGCGGSRTSGSEGGPGRPTSGNVDRALRPDPYTYVKTHAGWVYAAFIIDVFARMVVGWQISNSLRSGLAIDALEMAVWNRTRAGQVLDGLVHHSDRGVQYLSIRYSERLADNDIVASVGSPRRFVRQRHGRGVQQPL